MVLSGLKRGLCSWCSKADAALQVYTSSTRFRRSSGHVSPRKEGLFGSYGGAQDSPACPAGTDDTPARGSCVERWSLRHEQLLLSCSPAAEPEMITPPQKPSSICFHLSCRFHKIRGIKSKRQQLDAPEIVYIKNLFPIMWEKLVLDFNIRAARERSNTPIWKNFSVLFLYLAWNRAFLPFVKSSTEVWAAGKVKGNTLAGGHHFTF